MTKVYKIDPLCDKRWPEFLKGHKLATVFHSAEWLDALRRTYGYRASALTTSGPGERLENALVFCRVQSWLTGRRLVSLPFSDHCAPLINTQEDLSYLLAGLKHEWDQGREKYLEIRSDICGAGVAAGFTSSGTFCLHRLDLSPSLSDLFHAFHANCIRRKIARAEREGVTYVEGTTEDLLQHFYQLAVLTRRRHTILPQPMSWFRNLITCTGERAKLRLAFKEGRPIAGILTIRYKGTMTYKYGCSDLDFHKFGPMQLLMWKTIQEAKSDGLVEFDMGRTDWDNKGLLHFKDRWGCERTTLKYLRHPGKAPENGAEKAPLRIPKKVFVWAPDSALITAGGMLYRHIG